MEKKLIWLGLVIGSAAGSHLPTLWGSPAYSMSSVLLSAVGGILGIWLGYRLGR